jgi:SAM-dependent methyltransferase
VDASDLYLRVREKEGRLYPDDVATRLPDISTDHPLRIEWRARADSLRRLLRYCGRLPQPVSILELGCGNGWLSSRIGSLPGVRVWGLDRTGIELTQATRLFKADNIAFLSADIFSSPFLLESFDIIILASVIQYFPDLPALLRSLSSLLTPRGEIHLLDSPLYTEAQIAFARARTHDHYSALGFPEMADHYFHHTVSSLQQFSPHWLYRPHGLQARISRYLGHVNSPFPWLSISKPGNAYQRSRMF